ncbi:MULTISPECIES: hypothetical protein [unclassified Pseudomonas]
MTQAQAAEVTLSAEYRGEAEGRFHNTTRQAGFCAHWPSDCVGIETVGLPVSYIKRTEVEASDPRDRFFIQVPGRRNLQVTHTQTGETYPLSLEIQAVSQQVVMRGLANPVFTRYPRGGCTYRRTFSAGPWTMYLWDLKNPAAPQACNSGGYEAKAGDVYTVRVQELAISYRLSMPSPLSMKPGLFRGHLDYSIGPGGDFDFGNDVTNLNTDQLRVNFELDVQHAFVIDFPAGSERVVLEPPNGWLQWLNRGHPPQRLYRDMPMRIWSSGPFKAYKLCQYPVGGQCGIRNAAGHEVPVAVAVSLPSGIRSQGREVRRLELPSEKSAALAFEAQQAVFNRSASLHFDVAREPVKEMLKHPGSTYRGDVTVVFDADI